MRNIVLAAAFAAFLSAPSAFAFGTVDALGQGAEHERITRHALGCVDSEASNCFQHDSLVELAGETKNFGAIGIPDRGSLIDEKKAHCDSGDYLDVPFYPQTKDQARAALENCRNWMIRQLNAAVSDSGELVNGNGRLRKDQLGMPCVFVGRIGGRAKCDSIQDLGILLHGAQDFYSHTNWVDSPDASRPIALDNPPGLAMNGRAPWLDLRRDQPFPDGLISGCFEGVPESRHCEGHVKHAFLNKDEGEIDPLIGAGTTMRGQVSGNFARAVSAAIDDTRDKWATFEESLAGHYGPETGARIACAISHDHPVADCP